MTQISFIDRGDGVRLACQFRAGTRPAGETATLVFLPGYMSDMEGTKAVALDAWAAEYGHAMLRFDYSGCGRSQGAFELGTLSRWRDDALAAIGHFVPEGPLLLIGSSMGGWLMLLTALALPGRVAGLVGIAAAPDFTEWGFSDDEKARLQREGLVAEPSPYSETPMITTLDFWQSGQANLLLESDIAIDAPVRLLHGHEDDDVPWPISLKLANELRSENVRTVIVKGGDHRLSRLEDLGLLLTTVGELLEPR